MELRERLVSNTLSNGFRLLVNVAVGLLVPPFVISELGVEDYGIWVLLLAIGSLIYIFDLGLQPALTKFVAEARVRDDFPQLNRDINTVLFVYLMVAGGTLVASWLAAPLLMSLYFQGHSSTPHFETLILCFIGLSAFAMVSDVFQTVLSGLHRIDQANLFSTLALILQTLCLVAFLLMGHGLWAIAVSMGLGYILRATLTFNRVRHYLPNLQIEVFSHPQWEDIRRLFYLGSSGLAVRISGISTGQLSKLLIGYFGGISWVAYYDLASRIVGQFGGISSIMFAALIPTVSQLKTQGDKDRINRLVERSLMYMNLLALPFFWFLLIFAKGLIAAWLGPGFETVAMTLQILIVAHYINLLSGPAFHALIGMGKPILGIWAAVINSFVFCIGALIGGYSIGYWGIIAGEFIGVAMGGLFLTVMYHRTESVVFWKPITRAVILPSSLILITAFCFALAHWGLGLDKLVISLWLWAVEFFMYWLIAMGLLRLAGMVGSYEWALVHDILRRSSPAPAQ